MYIKVRADRDKTMTQCKTDFNPKQLKMIAVKLTC